MNRAYSLLDIKTVDDEEWVIEGIASTPAADRVGDIVEPLGAQFTVPMPLLWQHDSSKPVGEVTFARPTAKGIPFRASITKASIFTSQTLRERALEAWESVKHRLVRAVSIGFSNLESEPIKGTYGIRFLKWEWLELSLVTIPANAEASISLVKQYDRPAASGNGRSLSSPGVSGTLSTTAPRGTMKTIEESIASLEATRANKQKRLEDIVQAAETEGRTKNEAEREEFDTLSQDIEAVDGEIKDLQNLQQIQSRAKPVAASDTKTASTARDTRVTVVHPAKPEPGIQFARFAMCMAKAKGDTNVALNLMKAHYPSHPAIKGLTTARDRGDSYGELIVRMAEMRTKEAVGAGTTVGETWAEPLLAHNTFSGDFVEYLRPRTIIGQFGEGGRPALRRIPFNVHIKGQTSGGAANWVGESKPKPVTKFDYIDAYHGFAKVAAISVISEELIRFSDPSAEALVRNSLADVVIEKIDTDFIDPDKAVDAGVSPASITNTATATPSTGDDGDAVRTDMKTLFAAPLAANMPLSSAVLITTPAIALSASLMTNALGQSEFPNMSINGGTLLGFPVIVSNYVPEGVVILAFASEIYLSDDGVVTVDASREASIQMDTAPPTQDGTTGTGIAMVSMFQTNNVALRAERYINWSKRRTTAVAYLTGVEWGGEVS